MVIYMYYHIVVQTTSIMNKSRLNLFISKLKYGSNNADKWMLIFNILLKIDFLRNELHCIVWMAIYEYGF